MPTKRNPLDQLPWRTRSETTFARLSLANVVSLRVLHGNWSKGLRFVGIPQARERGLQDVARSKDHAPLNEILKFANVARPRVRRQFRHRFRGNLVDLSTHPVS